MAVLSGCATTGGIGQELGLSPHWTWKTFDTEHFRLTFPEELRDTAGRSARYLEEAHALLSPRLKWESRRKVEVVVIDNEDTANGLTSAVAHLGMVFYVTPPDNWFSTYYYDDWLRLLAIHEYTHYLNMDPTTDFWQVLRYGFGDLMLPNSAWPTWMLEGLAVYMETRLTGAGRGRSPFYDMILRSAVEDGVLDTHDFVTLDRVNGTNPYYPGGETAYLFGYQLMNRIAGGAQASGESALGEMSWRSSGRIPYLINANLSSITGKDWYAYWEEWLTDTRARAQAQLSKIRSKPLTPFRKLTQAGRQTLGSAFSPDGKWAAWTQETADRPMSLWLMDRKTGVPKAVEDKLLGSSLAFTPDSSTIVMSMLRRTSNYALYSELAAYDLKSGAVRMLTQGMRARDPDVSRDGKLVVFTRAMNATTVLMIATLEHDEGGWKLGQVEGLFHPAKYDAVFTPKFSADGKRVYFTWHSNGKAQEDLASIDLETKQVTALVADGKFNRFPTVDPEGKVWFISDRTGVDTVYQWNGKAAEQKANITTGLSFPSFDPKGRLHASVFSHTGWDLAELDITAPAASEPLDAPPAPIRAPDSISKSDDSGSERALSSESSVHDYSTFPSIWPRQWAPLLTLRGQGSLLAGATVIGFDTIDIHEYMATAAYDTQIQKPEWSLLYANRAVGPVLSFLGENTTNAIVTGPGLEVLSYSRRLKLAAAAAFPIRWTFSTLTPALSVNSERTTVFLPGYDPANDDVFLRSRYVPSIDASLVYSQTHRSALAITAEEGRATALAVRYYFDDPEGTWKALFKETEYFRVTDHSVLVPSLKASWASRRSSYLGARVEVEGRNPGNLVESLPGDSLDQLSLRGYPNRIYYARSAGGGSLDYRFPLLRIFRGWGTNPAYLENLFGFTFAEVTYFPGAVGGFSTLPAAGGGLRLSGDAFLHLPVVLSVEYHRGFRENAGGAGEFFFQAGVSNFGF